MIVVPNRSCRRDLRAWIEKLQKEAIVCPEATKKSVQRIATVDRTTEDLFDYYHRGFRLHKAVGLRKWTSGDFLEFFIDCNTKFFYDSRSILIALGGLQYHPIDSNPVRNFLLRASSEAFTLPWWSQKLLVKSKEDYTTWIREIAYKINPIYFFVINHSAPSDVAIEKTHKTQDTVQESLFKTVYEVIE